MYHRLYGFQHSLANQNILQLTAKYYWSLQDCYYCLMNMFHYDYVTQKITIPFNIIDNVLFKVYTVYQLNSSLCNSEL